MLIFHIILNTQSVNTIFSIFNFPPTGGYQLHRLLSSTHDSSTSYRSYLVFMKTSFRLPGPQRIGARSEALFDKFFLPLLSYQSSVTQITDMVNYSYQFLTQYLVQISEKGLARPQTHHRHSGRRRRRPTNTHTTHCEHCRNTGSITIHNLVLILSSSSYSLYMLHYYKNLMAFDLSLIHI